MKKKRIRKTVAILLIICILGGCGLSGQDGDDLVKWEENAGESDAESNEVTSQEGLAEDRNDSEIKKPLLLDRKKRRKRRLRRM